MINHSTAANLLKVKKTQLEMIRDRGGDITSEEGLLTFESDNDEHVNNFINIYQAYVTAQKIPFRRALNRIYTLKSGARILVYYASPESGTSKLGVGPLKEVLGEAKKIEQLQTLIVITEVDLSPDAYKAILDVKIYFIQHFYDDNLKYNLTKHKFVPQHRALSDEEARDFLTRNGLKPGQLPILKFVDPLTRLTDKDRKRITDPVISYYGFRPGQIIEIHRVNFITETLAERQTVYKIVSY